MASAALLSATRSSCCAVSSTALASAYAIFEMMSSTVSSSLMSVSVAVSRRG
jgi:hypothetical protein